MGPNRLKHKGVDQGQFMLVKFWGVRGSIPAPSLANQVQSKIIRALHEAAARQINLADSEEINQFVAELPLDIRGTVGGNTACITVETPEGLVIFDAGSGIRELGGALMKREFGRGQGQASIFFTHTHWDHIQGFPFFRPAFVPGNRFTLYCIHPYVEQVIVDQMKAEWFPVQFDYLSAHLEFKPIKEDETVKVAGLEISSKPLQHPGTAYAYRIDNGTSSVVLATDGEYKHLSATHTKGYIDFFAGADILIFDAMFSVRESFIREDWGHSSALIGADMARHAGVKKLVLFHHDPVSEDDEVWRLGREAEEYLAQDPGTIPPSVVVATEGLEINLSDRHDFAVRMDLTGDAAILSLCGEFDAHGVEVFETQFGDLVDQNHSRRVVLDLEKVTELNMAGVKALLEARKQVSSMALVRLPSHIRRVLELTGTTDFFAIYEDMDLAREC
jgi:anti-anti-sigma factor